MVENFQRIAVALIGIALLFMSILFLAKPGSLFLFTEEYRDRYPVIRAFNPLTRFNSKRFSRVTAILIGVGSLLMGLLILTVCIFGKAD